MTRIATHLLHGLLLVFISQAAVIKPEGLDDSYTQKLPPRQQDGENIVHLGVLLPKPKLPPIEVNDGGPLDFVSNDKIINDDIMVRGPRVPPSPVGNNRVKRKVDGTGWPDNVVPYEFSNRYRSYSEGIKSMLREAMRWWSDATCITFREARSSDRVRLSFSNDGGCRSYVGYQADVKNGRQEIKLQDSQCFSTAGTSAHEIGHALGLIHEQSRTDRDKHIDIHIDRINEASLHNFQIFYTSRIPDGTKYDLNSIMHYKPNIFTAMPFSNLPTMTAKNPSKDVLMGQRDALGYYDVMAVNKEYCQGNCQDNCLNEGYVIYKNGRCSCVCPEGLTGSRCERVATSCGDEITLGANQERRIYSPSSYSGRECVWLITAPQGYLVEVEFERFDIAEARGSGSSCAHTVEVRNNILGQRGDIYCGTGPLGPFDTKLDVKNNQMMIVLDATDTRVPAKDGFTAKLRAYKDACLSDPCANGGVCSPVGSYDYTCSCPTGYQGKNCDRVKDAAVECDFKSDLCNFRNDDKDQIDMQRMFSSSKYLETITRDSNGNKFFIGAPVEFQTGLKDQANLISPVFSGSAVPKRCLEFYYQMGGNYQGQGELSATIKSVSGSDNVIFNVRGSQGSRWQRVTKEIELSSDYEVVLTIQSSDKYPFNSMIAIDDVSIKPQSCYGACSRNPCPVQGSTCVEPASGGYYCVCPTGRAGDRCDNYDTEGFTCSFDANDNCGWRNDARTTYDFMKSYGAADAQQRTGPKTGAGGRGSYMNADTSSSGAGPSRVARLESPVLDGSGSMCVEFYHTMYGSDIGSLAIKLNTNNRLESRTYFLKSGDQGRDWNYEQVDIYIPSNSRLVFEATSGPRHLSDIAIDEVKITRGSCGRSALGTVTTARAIVTRRPTTTARPPPRTTTTAATAEVTLERKLGNGDVLAECNFERGMCEDDIVFLKNNNGHDWTRTRESTPSSGTGPNYASQGAYFIFTEASDKETGEKHSITTHLLYNSMGKACISFDYHMSGDGTGSLAVFQKKERGSNDRVWYKNGEQGSGWQHALIDIDMARTSFYQIIFESEVGPSYRSDIALDDIKILRGTCSSFNRQQEENLRQQTSVDISCNFNGGNICAPDFVQKTNDDFDWELWTGPTRTQGTGPDGAAEGARYLVIESSNRDARARAVIQSATIPASIGEVCLRLQYHMQGTDMGTFSIYQVTADNRRSRIFSKTGDQGDSWQLLKQSIPNSNQQYTLEFEAELSSSDRRYFGDMAMDNITIRSGSC